MNIDQLDRTLINEETIHAPPCEQTMKVESSTPDKSFKPVACHEMKMPKIVSTKKPVTPPGMCLPLKYFNMNICCS